MSSNIKYMIPQYIVLVKNNIYLCVIFYAFLLKDKDRHFSDGPAR